MDFMHNGWTTDRPEDPSPDGTVIDGLQDFWVEGFLKVKGMYAKLINAKPSEISFTVSTTVGENTLVNGIDFQGGHVVTNDLHYSESLSDYLWRQELRGVEVRIVKNRDCDIDYRDMERAVDKNTR
jgi:selenocysteine lyase/cysteine desulfurase